MKNHTHIHAPVSKREGNALLALDDGLYIADQGEVNYSSANLVHRQDHDEYQIEVTGIRNIVRLKEGMDRIYLPKFKTSKDVLEITIIREDGADLNAILTWAGGVTVNGEDGPATKQVELFKAVYLVRGLGNDWTFTASGSETDASLAQYWAEQAEASANRTPKKDPRWFDKFTDIREDDSMNNKNTPMGSVIRLPEVGELVRTLEGDVLNKNGLHFDLLKFARAKSSAFICPEEVLVTLPSGDYLNDTALIAKTLNGAIDHGYGVQVNRLYSIEPIVLPATKKGLTLTGLSGMRQKNGANNDVGFKAVAGHGEMTECLLQFGQNGVGGDFENFRSDGVTYHGNDAYFSQGLIWADRLSQGGGMLNTFTRARGPAFMMNKAEDLIFYGTSMVLLGANDWRGAVCFGRSSGATPASAYGTNAIRFIGGRMEWIDGPFWGMHPDQLVDAWASHVFVDGMKHEVGEHTVDGQTYGAYRTSYPVCWFPTGAAGISGSSAGSESEANTGNRVSMIFDGCFYNIAYNSDSVFWVGNVDDFVVRNPQFTLNNVGTLTLFKLQDENGGPCEARNFVLTGGNIRGNGGNPWMTNSQLNWINKNKLPIVFDLPNFSDFGGLPHMINDHVDGVLPMARYGNRPEITVGTQGNYFIEDPDPVVDPALAIEKSVMKVVAGTTVLRLAKSTQFSGQLVGIKRGGPSRGLRLRIRAKRVGTGTQNLYLRDDVSNNLMGRPITSSVWAWYEYIVPLATISAGLRLNATNVTETEYVLVDAFTVDYVDYVERTFQINLPSIPAGGRVAVTTAIGGDELLIPSAIVGDRVEWWPAPQFSGNMQGILLEPQITADGKLTVFASNPTAAAIDLVGYVGWVFRAKSR